MALVLIPATAGVMRLVQLGGGATTLPDKAQVTATPGWLAVHIVAGIAFALAGAAQFSPDVLRRWRRWHRASGRVVVVAGVAVALSALVMTPVSPHDTFGAQLLLVVRTIAATALAAGLVLGITTIRRGDVAGHRAWMARAYALALGAGTQTITIGLGQAALGRSDLTTALMQSAAWGINLAIAERAIRRHRRRPAAVPAAPRVLSGVAS